MAKHNFITLHPRAKDITGKTFGRLTAIGSVGKTKCGNYLWLCKCACGNTSVVASGKLSSGHTRSCDCLWLDAVTSHNMTGTPEHTTWLSMRDRCNNPRCAAYKHYGARGISVCPEWDDFSVFLSDVGHRPSTKHSIDRLDNDCGYTPNNTAWSTHTQQMRNTRMNNMLTHNGKTYCVSEWAEVLGVKRSTIANRLHRGWSVDMALSTPVKHQAQSR